MPLYEFVCENCGNERELLSKPGDIKQCSCGSTLTKKVSNTNFQLKGKGWYKDGYSK